MHVYVDFYCRACTCIAKLLLKQIRQIPSLVAVAHGRAKINLEGPLIMENKTPNAQNAQNTQIAAAEIIRARVRVRVRVRVKLRLWFQTQTQFETCLLCLVVDFNKLSLSVSLSSDCGIYYDIVVTHTHTHTHTHIYIYIYPVCSIRSMCGGFIFSSQGPLLKVHHGQCLISIQWAMRSMRSMRCIPDLLNH